jgi:hypothetical protein
MLLGRWNSQLEWKEIYVEKKQTNEWIYVHPTHFQETLRLAIKFNEINENEANY